ncbi:antibiotic biosynthesis monooxygenase [Streptomyces sp. NPDC059352]|uniref:antibiotic biosynthesis monooxygenase n=1 Tax=Streptomyces sp. NPDC059352 TaxID=3346810 RepID=UPI003676F4AF
MAVIVTVEIPGGTREQYEQSTEQVTSAEWWPPKGFIAHAAGPDGTGGWRVVDFWDSEEDFLAFAKKAQPLFERIGMPTIMPKMQEATNIVLR